MSNIKLDVLALDPDSETVSLVLAGEKTVGDYSTDYDEYLGVEFSPTWVMRYSKDKTLEMYDFELSMDGTINELLPNGLDYKIKGMYDIPEWDLFDLTAGEAVLHAWLKANSRWANKCKEGILEGTKHLIRKDLKFR
ncbi:MAG: hypothetical protein JXR48_04800 [Candidatus Delongbacteria bacterium]|nr:hypothetical protein [Candidatus Delongbacteria bacterium]MBN2834267.1 hypothetical protein [Candidatus Delongbacteria bacterium]